MQILKINYKIMTITKLFTGIALMQLVEQDKININDPDTSVKPISLAIN